MPEQKPQKKQKFWVVIERNFTFPTGTTNAKTYMHHLEAPTKEAALKKAVETAIVRSTMHGDEENLLVRLHTNPETWIVFQAADAQEFEVMLNLEVGAKS